MTISYLKVLPYSNQESYSKYSEKSHLSVSTPVLEDLEKYRERKAISFGGRLPKFASKYIKQKLLPPSDAKAVLGEMDNLYVEDIKKFDWFCFLNGKSRADGFNELVGGKKYVPKVLPVPSVTKIIGNTKMTSLMDGGQIFGKVLEDIKGAKKSIQIKMFEFQNMTIDGDDWIPRGAERVPGYEDQRQILETIIGLKKNNPNLKIQMILDAHKWGINAYGRKKHYNNQAMIMFLKKNGIDVVPAPRDSILNHDKYAIIDGKKAFIGGMNWGTHSPANHDFCWSLETLEGKENSEVDNLMQDFNDNWRFAWHRIGTKRLVAGPLNVAEQRHYSGIDKEIKPENVIYYNYVREFFNNPEAKGRYKENRLDLIPCRPMTNPVIHFVSTKPKEYEEIGLKAREDILEYLTKEVNTCKEIFGELFYFTDDEIIDTIIKRVHSGDLKAKFIMHEPDFPYCKRAYVKMLDNGLDVRLYKEDKSIDQRMHAKWLVFDNNRILAGSPNISRRAIRQNRGKGFRDDTPLTSQAIEDDIKEFIGQAKPIENRLHLSHLQWDGSKESYKKLKERLSMLRSTSIKLRSEGKAVFKFDDKEYFLKKNERAVSVNGTKYSYKDNDDRTAFALVRKLRTRYGNIYELHNDKEKFKRGNCESAIIVDSKEFVDEVFKPQFTKDWDYSKSAYEEQNHIKATYIPPKLDIQG